MVSKAFEVRACCGGSGVLDWHPCEEARVDPAFLEKYEASKTPCVCSEQAQEFVGRVIGSKSPVNPGNEVPVVAGRSVGI